MRHGLQALPAPRGGLLSSLSRYARPGPAWGYTPHSPLSPPPRHLARGHREDKESRLLLAEAQLLQHCIWRHEKGVFL